MSKLTDMDHKNLGLKNRGTLHSRTKWNRLEKAFADKWEKENKTDTCVHHGAGLLQALFDHGERSYGGGYRVHAVTASERFVAATVVQWLGTNCGFAFLLEVLRSEGMTISDIKTRKEIPAPPEKNPYHRRFVDA